jgi:hypothetical protein
MIQVISQLKHALLFCSQINKLMVELKEIYRSVVLLFILITLLLLASCGPMVLTTGVSEPPPPWFYPNRLEVVRYVYFPEYRFYYDLSARTYLFLDGGVWVRRNVLPPRYRSIDLRRSKYERIEGYRNDNIKQYHDDNNANRGRSNRTTPRNNTRRSG